MYRLDYGLLAFYICGGVFIITAVMNVCSMPEKSLSELQAEGKVSTVATLSSTLVDLLRVPVSILKLGGMMFLSMALMIVPLVWYTHHYTSTVYANTTLVGEDQRYTDGVAEGTKLMMSFPIVSIVISLLSMYFKLLERVSSRSAARLTQF